MMSSTLGPVVMGYRRGDPGHVSSILERVSSNLAGAVLFSNLFPNPKAQNACKNASTDR